MRYFNYSNWFSWKKGFACSNFIQCFICFSELLGKTIQCQVFLISWKAIKSYYGIDDMRHFTAANDYLSYMWGQELQLYLSRSSFQPGIKEENTRINLLVSIFIKINKRYTLLIFTLLNLFVFIFIKNKKQTLLIFTLLFFNSFIFY